jgi:hypothetical protein
MTLVRFKQFQWDWKDEPDWDKINEYIKEIGTTPYFYRYATNSDSCGVLVSDTPLIPEEVELLAEED